MKIKKVSDNPIIYKSLHGKEYAIKLVTESWCIKLNWFQKLFYSESYIIKFGIKKLNEQRNRFCNTTFGVPYK